MREEEERREERGEGERRGKKKGKERERGTDPEINFCVKISVLIEREKRINKSLTG